MRGDNIVQSRPKVHVKRLGLLRDRLVDVELLLLLALGSELGHQVAFLLVLRLLDLVEGLELVECDGLGLLLGLLLSVPSSRLVCRVGFSLLLL